MSAGIGDLSHVHTVMHIRMCIRQNRIQCTSNVLCFNPLEPLVQKVLWTCTFSTALSCTAVVAMIRIRNCVIIAHVKPDLRGKCASKPPPEVVSWMRIVMCIDANSIKV